MSDKSKSIESIDEGNYKTVGYFPIDEGLPRPINSPVVRYLITQGYFEYIFKQLEGQLLTITEAITDDKTKREAIKSLVRQSLWAESRSISLLKLEKIK